MPVTWCVHRYRKSDTFEWHYEINQLKVDNPRVGYDNYARSPNDALGVADMRDVEVPHLRDLAGVDNNVKTCPNNGTTYRRVQALANNRRLSYLHTNDACSNPGSINFWRETEDCDGEIRVNVSISIPKCCD